MKIQKVLVVVAHPDDEVLGVGGFIAKLASEGKSVHILLMNNGNSFRKDFSASDIERQIVAVSSLLGVGCSIQMFETSRFSAYAPTTFNGKVEEFIKLLKPDTVITHDENDLHSDHIVVHKAVMVACRYKHGSCVKNVLTFPVISSSDIHPNWQWSANYYVDIEKFIEIKIEAMQLYETEYKELAHHRGENAIRTWAAFYGLHANMKYAEPLKIIRATYE